MNEIKSFSFDEHCVNSLFHGWELFNNVLRIGHQITWKALKVIQGANYGSMEGGGQTASKTRAEVKRAIGGISSYSWLFLFFLVICVCFKDFWLDTFNIPHFAPIWNQKQDPAAAGVSGDAAQWRLRWFQANKTHSLVFIPTEVSF